MEPMGKRNVRRKAKRISRPKPMGIGCVLMILSSKLPMNPDELQNWNSPAREEDGVSAGRSQYSPSRKAILPMPAGRAEIRAGTHSIAMERQNRRSVAILPISGKILPISEFQLELTRLSSN